MSSPRSYWLDPPQAICKATVHWEYPHWEVAFRIAGITIKTTRFHSWPPALYHALHRTGVL